MIKIKMHFDGIPEQQAHWQAMLAPLLDKHLEPLLASHGMHEAILHATLSRLKRRDHHYTVRFHMHLPGRKIVAANGEGEDAHSATAAAVERLLRETKRHFAHLHHQDEYKRRARRERLHALKEQIAALAPEALSQAETGIAVLLPRLEEIARRELAYLRAVGDLPADYPTLRDVVDETIASVKAAWQPGKDQQAVFRQLLKQLFKIIDREVAASRQFGETVSLDALVTPDAKDQAEAMVQEEFYEYYQPDDTVNVADVIAAEEAEAALPDASAEREQAWIVDVIKDLPIAWRRALLLGELECLPTSDIGEILDISEESVARQLDQAINFVQARLADAGMVEVQASAREAIRRLLRRPS
ncbi:hypothetical protein [Thiobacter aerophilum]|uniref:RNA polymerase sigma factor 70 region 4 type 2 domain-containing protein n=1 Tax=Thiobacter aerophilum TaxID=3121275 RepID=A0ABV0EIQ8_9BURK